MFEESIPKKDIDYALVEEKRPAFYRAMKYWGKKPHNIWREYIRTYTPKEGLYLDPFAGSAISAFEAVKINRKAIAFDINPLTSFLIEVMVSDFDEGLFKEAVLKIIDVLEKDSVYQEYYSTKCEVCGKNAIAQNYKWNDGVIYEVGVECQNCVEKKNKLGRSLKSPDNLDIKKSKDSERIKISYWFPDDKFPNSPSFSAGFIKNIGGNNFSFIWTRRNLYILSRIFNEIINTQDETLKKQLLFGFIQTLHLCTKMCVPRRAGANRAFSTSWGRPAFLCSARQMEMNPLLVFKSSCLSKQSVMSSLSDCYKYLGKKVKLIYVDKSNKSNRSKNFDIKYGIVDINNITDYIDEKSIDFIMTDPPYGGLVQYLDLSSLWLVWLKKYDAKYTPEYEAEITIKKGVFDENSYKQRFLNGIKNLYKVLKDDGKIVFTFHNKEIKIWNIFLGSLSLAGFRVEKVIHQQNRRTGESNVANPYGTSATDFYIRCIKSPVKIINTDEDQFEHFILTKATQLIAERLEPTPYQILFNGLLAEISNAGFNLENFDKNIEKILSKNIGTIFKLTPNNSTKAGNFWWFTKPEDYIKYPDKKLSERVEETILSLLRRKIKVSFDDVIAEIFIKYPNGLTPDIKSISCILKKYAVKSGGKWLYKATPVIEKELKEHSRILSLLNSLGKKIGYQTFIGRKEQSEILNGKKLSDICDFKRLDFLNRYDPEQIKRIEMIDMLWLKNKKIEFAIEVENSTNFTSGIQRASNLGNEIPKIMIIPNHRKQELLSIKDPFFVKGFIAHNWQYMLYDEVEKIESLNTINVNELHKYLAKIKE